MSLAVECGVPDTICHVIAAHAGERDMVQRSTGAFLVYPADFMGFELFRNPAN